MDQKSGIISQTRPGKRGLFELKRGFPAYDSIPDQRADLV